VGSFVAERESSRVVLEDKYTRWVMDMLAKGVHNTEVHLLLLNEYFEGRIITIAGEPSSACAAVPRPSRSPAAKKLNGAWWWCPCPCPCP